MGKLGSEALRCTRLYEGSISRSEPVRKFCGLRLRIDGARLMENTLEVGEEQADALGGSTSSRTEEEWSGGAVVKDASEAMLGVPLSSLSAPEALRLAAWVWSLDEPSFLLPGLFKLELVAPSALLRLEVLLRLFLAAVRARGDLASTGRARAGRMGSAALVARGDRLGLAACWRRPASTASNLPLSLRRLVAPGVGEPEPDEDL